MWVSLSSVDVAVRRGVEGVVGKGVAVRALAGEHGLGTGGLGVEGDEFDILLIRGEGDNQDGIVGFPGEGLVIRVGGAGAGDDGSLDGNLVGGTLLGRRDDRRLNFLVAGKEGKARQRSDEV